MVEAIETTEPKEATVGTDKLDYQPGEVVTISGANFAPGEAVALVLHEEPGTHADLSLSAIADANGDIVNTDYAPQTHDLGVTYTLTATGATSGRVATTQFMDNHTAVSSGAGPYTYAVGTGGTIVPGTTRLPQSCDDCTTGVNLPFSVTLYDRVYSYVAVGSNGNLQFGSNRSDYSNGYLSNASMFAYTILPFWDDLWTAPTGGVPGAGIYTSVSGSAPNRIFNIEWRTAYYYARNSYTNFEVRLFEGQDRFQVIYGRSDISNGASIGVMKNTSTYTQYSVNEASTIYSGLTLTYTRGNRAPVANAGPDQTLSCILPGQSTPVALDGRLSSDPDGNALSFQWYQGTATLSTSSTPVVNLLAGTQDLTLSVSDGSQSASDSVRISLIPDTTPPTMTLAGGNASIECASSYTDPGATATDACSGALTVTRTGSVANGTPGTYFLSYAATDQAGLSASASRTVTVADTTAPAVVLTGQTQAWAECGRGAYVDPGVTASDVCRGDVTSTVVTSGAVNTNVVGDYALTYTAPEGANPGVAARTVWVRDRISPFIYPRGGVGYVQCGSEYTDPGAVATDWCSGDLTARLVTTGQVLTGTPGVYTISYSATDDVGLANTGSRDVTVQDTLPPTVTLTGGDLLAHECGSGAFVDPGATASDVCSGDVSQTLVRIGQVQPGTVGDYVLTYTANDNMSLTASSTRVVSVTDTLAPQLTLLVGNDLVECGGSFTDAGATASDLCTGNLSAQIVGTGSVHTGLPGSYALGYSVSDVSGHTTSGTRSVTVQDTTPPTVRISGAALVAHECGTGAYLDPGATASDVCSGDLTTRIVTSGAVNAAVVGTYALSYSAVDNSGLGASDARTVSVEDTLAPTLSINGGSVVLECNVDTYVDAGATASDVCAGNLSSAIRTTNPVDRSVVASYLVTYAVTDPALHTTSGSRGVTVRDTLAPTLTLPADLTLEATSPAGATATFTSSASDICSGALTPSCARTSGETFALGTTTVPCSATDAQANRTSGSFAVRVVDTTPPVVTAPASATAIATSAAGSVVTYPGATASDIVDLNASASCLPASGSLFPLGATTVTCSSTDFSGNTGTATFTVTVIYAWTGFLRPINQDSSSVFKLGSTVPVKFQLAGASSGITNATGALYLSKVTDSVVGTELQADSTSAATTGNLFRYDPTSDQYIFNLSTKGLSTGTWQLRVDLGDGVFRTVFVSLR
jgi:hypothetical protein